MARALRARASRDTVATAGILAVCAGFYTVFIARTAFRIGDTVYFSLFDDAMVSMRYARNLAHGDGLVWNPGEPAVEGYTNFLWTLWMSVLHLVGIPDRLVSLAVMISGALVLLATVAVIGAVARRLSVHRAVPLLAMLATGLCYPLVYWTLRGMEVGLLAFLISTAVLLALRLADGGGRRDRALLALVVVAALLTRTDAAVPMAAVGLWQLWASAPRRRVGDAATVAVPLVATLAAHTLFRLAYYGDALPNTYYLKLGGFGLGDRLGRGIEALVTVEFTYLLIPAALAAVVLWAAEPVVRRRAALLAGVALSAALYSVYVGADAWEWMAYPNRYVTPVAPVLFALGAAGATLLVDGRGRRPFALLLACGVLAIAVVALARPSYEAMEGASSAAGVLAYPFLAACVAALVWLGARARGGRLDSRVAAGIGVLVILGINAGALGEWVRSGGEHVGDDAQASRVGVGVRHATKPDAEIAVVWAGAMPYFADRPAVDLLGKSDATIAHEPPKGFLYPGHNKWDYDFSIRELRPDVVVELWKPTGADEASLARWGYERVGDRSFELRAGTRVDRRRLAAAVSVLDRPLSR